MTQLERFVVNYCRWSDRQLVVGIQHGNEDCFSELVKRYRPLIERVARTYHFDNWDRDDLIQECTILMYTTITRYDIFNKTSYGHFLKRLLANHFCSLIRRQHAYKRRSDLWSERIEYTVTDESGQQRRESPVDFIEASAVMPDDVTVVHDLMANYLSALSAVERAVFIQIILGLNYHQMAQALALEERAVRNAYSRCRTKLIKLMKE